MTENRRSTKVTLHIISQFTFPSFLRIVSILLIDAQPKRRAWNAGFSTNSPYRELKVTPKELNFTVKY